MELEGGRIDWLLSAFYFLNSLQEYPQGGKLGSLDEVGRFQYKLSYQAHFNSALENKVQFCFDQLLLEIPQLSGFKKKIRPTRVFLTHDIDSIYGAFREDRNYWLKRFNPFMAAKVVLNELLGNPGWFTIDRIMKIEDEYDLKSTFFWLVNQGKVNERELNADYDLHSPMVWNALERLNYRGWENGIHKSISTDSLQLEMEKAKFQPAANRYHYLKFQLPGLYDSVEQAGLKLDASLGFAEQYGFRNSYALPFTPFNVKERRPYALVEAPLHIMDGTFQRYMNVSGVDAGKAMVDFFEAHAANAVISVLWHNSFCTDYKYGEFFKAYKTLLVYLYEKGIKSIGADEIVKEFELTSN